MNEDSPDDPLDDDALKALLERPFTELSFDELMAMKAAYTARGIQIYNSASFEQLVLAFLAGNVGVPVVQALSQRAANSIADLSKQVTDAAQALQAERTPRRHPFDRTPGQPDRRGMASAVRNGQVRRATRQGIAVGQWRLSMAARS